MKIWQTGGGALEMKCQIKFYPKGVRCTVVPPNLQYQLNKWAWFSREQEAKSMLLWISSHRIISFPKVQWAWEDQSEVCLREDALEGCEVLLPLWGSKCPFKNLLNRSKSRSESKLICPSLNFILQALSSGVQFIEPSPLFKQSTSTHNKYAQQGQYLHAWLIVLEDLFMGELTGNYNRLPSVDGGTVAFGYGYCKN